MLKMNKLEIKR